MVSYNITTITIGDEVLTNHWSCRFCKQVEMADKSGLSPLDISGPAHVVAECWRKWKRSFKFYAQGKNLWDRRPN